MTAISYGSQRGRITARTSYIPRKNVYGVLLEDGTTASVVERTTLLRNINDEYMVEVFDDANFNVFLEKL